MKTDADDILIAYFLEHDRRESPPSLGGRFARDDVDARLHSGGTRHWPSGSTRGPSGMYETLVWIVKPVSKLGMCVLREHLLGVGEIWDKPNLDAETGQVLRYMPTTLRPKAPVIAVRLGVPAGVVRACIRDAKLIVVERAAQVGWRRAA